MSGTDDAIVFGAAVWRDGLSASHPPSTCIACGLFFALVVVTTFALNFFLPEEEKDAAVHYHLVVRISIFFFGRATIDNKNDAVARRPSHKIPQKSKKVVSITHHSSLVATALPPLPAHSQRAVWPVWTETNTTAGRAKRWVNCRRLLYFVVVTPSSRGNGHRS
jgi:hypothetical protein